MEPFIITFSTQEKKKSYLGTYKNNCGIPKLQDVYLYYNPLDRYALQYKFVYILIILYF